MPATLSTELSTGLKGAYALLTRATFSAKTMIKKEDDPAQEEEIVLPDQLQASVYRADMLSLACRMGDRKGLSCWLQFQCVPSELPRGQGFAISELLEALGHHDKFYSTCYKQKRIVNVYKAKLNKRDGTVWKDTRKKGPHYEHHMEPLPSYFTVPANWYLLVQIDYKETLITYHVTLGGNKDADLQIPLGLTNGEVLRTPTVGELKLQVLKQLYHGADYYVYRALGKDKLDLFQVMYSMEYQPLKNDVELPYNQRTKVGYRTFEIQLLDSRAPDQVVLYPLETGYWPTPSTHTPTIDPMSWVNTLGEPTDPDTDWEDEDTMGPEGDGATEVHDDYMSKKRQRGD